jgi:pimeloyl-ACP methyl ester carboxylesterase
MIVDARGSIDYEACGAGPTVVLVPGSCSTGGAWRPVTAEWHGRFRCVTTSLLGYGGTAERRSARDPSIVYEAEIVEAVARRAGGPTHLVGHSFGGLVALAVALRSQVRLASLAIVEAPAMELLRDCGENRHYHAFQKMTGAYFEAFDAGVTEAIAAMIDFYGGSGTYASWPERVRAYAVKTTAVNILDWASARSFSLTEASLAAITVPTLVLWGEASHPAVRRANALLGECVGGAISATIEGAAHFMISTHASEVARHVAAHVHRAEARGISPRLQPVASGSNRANQP